jgi:uncharacterized surface protein with fasciclin (FAS1) repeats
MSTTTTTITEIVVASSDFDLLELALTTANLAGVLDDPTGDFTVFAPTDAAFLELAQALGFVGTSESAAFDYTVEALTLLSGGGDPVPLLTDILLYHVAAGSLFAEDVLAADSIPTLLGASVGVDGTTLVDGDPDIADPGIVATDIVAANGVVHVIDGVLIPVDLLVSDGSNDVDFIIGSSRSERLSVGRDNDFVDANAGNDHVNAGAGDDVALGGTGNDTLLGMRGSDTLRGEDGHDVVSGGQGNDVVDGGAGNDHLIGGRGNDVFVFAHGGDKDRIEDFRNGQDKLDLSDFGFVNYHHFQSDAHVYAHGKSVIIDFGGGDKVTLDGMKVSQIDASDFILA